MADWYPDRESQLVQWHNTFASALNSYSVTLGIAPAVVTQATVDAANVAMVLNAVDIANNYRSEIVAFKDQVLRGLINTPLPPAPTQPDEITFPPGSLGNIEARTRQLVAQIKANSAFTQQIGADMGILAPSSTPGNPSLVSVTAQPNSHVDVRVTFAGAPAVALFRQVGTGDWSQIAVLLQASYTDTGAPATPGQPETRNYRVQAYVNNLPTGPYSAILSVVTIP